MQETNNSTVSTPVISRKRSRTSSASSNLDWCWICSKCFHVIGADLIGTDAKVWWSGDSVAYSGVISAFDSFSLCPQVQYSDDEWEYVDVSSEPVLLKMTSELILSLSRKTQSDIDNIS